MARACLLLGVILAPAAQAWTTIQQTSYGAAALSCNGGQSLSKDFWHLVDAVLSAKVARGVEEEGPRPLGAVVPKR